MIFRYAYLGYKRIQLKRFLQGAHNARQTQHAALLAKIYRNASSAYGRDHGFSEIHSVGDFRTRQPIMSFEDVEPYVERVMRGEVTAMFSPETRVRMFAMSDGIGRLKVIWPDLKETVIGQAKPNRLYSIRYQPAAAEPPPDEPSSTLFKQLNFPAAKQHLQRENTRKLLVAIATRRLVGHDHRLRRIVCSWLGRVIFSTTVTSRPAMPITCSSRSIPIANT